MKKRVSLFMFILCAVLSLSSSSSREIRKTFSLENGVVVEVSLLFPEHYEESGRAYPLLFVFNAHEYVDSFSSILNVMADFGYAPDVIIVSLQSDNPFSIYTPSRAGIPGGEVISGSGGGPQLRTLLAHEIIPWIETSYPVSPFRLAFGHSVGGLWVLDDLIRRDPLFSAHAAASPSCWWDEELLTSRAVRREARSMKGSLFMCMGNEGETMGPPAKRFFQAVTQRQGSVSAEFLSFEKTDHQMIPVIAFSHSMAFLFNDWKVRDELLDRGYDAVDQIVREINKKYGTHRKIPERFINRFGYEAMKQGDFERALFLFSRNCTLYPESANVWDSLGEAYEKSGQPEKAAASYEKRDEIKASKNASN